MNQDGDESPPTLMKVGGALSLFCGGLMVLVATVVSLGGGDLSGLRDTPFGGWAIPFWGIGTLLTGTLLLMIGWGIRARRSWIRPVIVVFWLFLGLQSILALVLATRKRQSWEVDFSWLLCLGFAVWYFYRKRNVVSYFESLSRQREA
jgi:hypothetical protein